MPRQTPRPETTDPPTHPQPNPEPFAGARAIIAPEAELITIESAEGAPAATGTLARAKPRGALHSSGDLAVEAGADVGSSISTEAKLDVGAGARLRGNVRAAAGARFGDGARVEGALEVQGLLEWGAGASAASVRVDGAFVTSEGLQRATRVRASGGIRPGDDGGARA